MKRAVVLYLIGGTQRAQCKGGCMKYRRLLFLGRSCSYFSSGEPGLLVTLLTVVLQLVVVAAEFARRSGSFCAVIS